ncbi:hypothetical protein [Phenylobacterium sp.]|uniref:hypothetical protein n=1 Tax=Phenylobacterium sp. TaxID=1871053 RepID=UPI0027309B09|nr:hypothetical protein [Phenylobacterium sp.]MDP1599388.1 hypothetical protein [Phenylobacterium sp.]MDP3592739.1 hypothetical protein [Phenylobacterium sp.]
MSDPSSFAARTRRELAKRRRPLTAAASLAFHGLIVLALLNAAPTPPMAVMSEPVVVELVAPRFLVPAPVPVPVPTPDPAPAPPAPATPTPPVPPPPVPKPTPPKRSPIKARKAVLPAPPDIKPLPATEAPAADTAVEVSEAQLAGAATAGSGSGGGSGTGAGEGGGDCNMLARLQRALRKDPMVQSAVTQVHRGKAIMVWNGGWVRHPGQEGGGLAAVREAMMWEIGFAPEACRKERVRGLVVVSLKDGSGSARLVLGENDWRWSDLLFVPGTGGTSQR